MRRRVIEYGLDVTNNSKAGPSFSLPRSKSCVEKTGVCSTVCYGNGIRYQSLASKAKRERHFRTVEYLLENGGSSLLAENLVSLVDSVRPIDWIASKVSGGKTEIPWTFRIHDVGDFYSVAYVQAWVKWCV